MYVIDVYVCTSSVNKIVQVSASLRFSVINSENMIKKRCILSQSLSTEHYVWIVRKTFMSYYSRRHGATR